MPFHCWVGGVSSHNINTIFFCVIFFAPEFEKKKATFRCTVALADSAAADDGTAGSVAADGSADAAAAGASISACGQRSVAGRRSRKLRDAKGLSQGSGQDPSGQEDRNPRLWCTGGAAPFWHTPHTDRGPGAGNNFFEHKLNIL